MILKSLVNKNTRGNLLIDIEIEMPESISEREERVFQEYCHILPLSVAQFAQANRFNNLS